MQNPSKHQGFTRKELLVTLGLLAVLGLIFFGPSWRGGSGFSQGIRVNAIAKQARDIHALLWAWAEDHNGEFPTAKQSSNEAFRELFRAHLVDTEKLFSIAGDAWHKNSPAGDGKGPDNDIGTEPEFTQALRPGECAFAYVTGLNQTSDPQLPLVANAFTESLGVYTDDKSRKGGVFRGEKCAYVTVGGSARVGNLNSDFRLLEKRGSKTVDVFSREWGINPDNIKNPEG